MVTVPASLRAKKLALQFGTDARAHVGRMLDRQNLNGQPAFIRNLPGGSIGHLGAGALPEHGNVFFFTGLPINGPDVQQIADADAAARLLPQFDGAFAGVFWDASRQTLVVVTDCLGMQPLYMRHADGELTLVSETKALRGDQDLAAWGAFISLGHCIGERSLMSGLTRVPPASILIYDHARRRLDIRRYWQWPDPADTWRDFDFLAALEKDIHAYAAFGNPGTLLLSGGFDSRLLLFLLQRAGIPADALIIAHEDEYHDADGRLAEAVAILAGVRFRKACPAPNFFASAEYLDYLNACDAGYPTLDLFIAKVASQIGNTAVWEGLVPGFAFMPIRQPEGAFGAFMRQEIRGRDSAIWRAAKILFKPEVVEAMFEGFAEDLRAETSRLPQDAFGLARFVIETRSRHRNAVVPLKVYANRADAFTPGLSKDFMTHAAIIPLEEKQGARFYRSLLARLDKRSLHVPFLSGGELMKGKRLSPAYGREHLRHAYYDQRARHPSLFPSRRRSGAERSTFLGEHLFDDDGGWLDPQARARLKSVSNGNYAAWKLLFHWKAWQWVHEGRLKQMLGMYRSDESSQVLPE